MNVSEKDALDRWCPFARVPHPTDIRHSSRVPVNRHANGAVLPGARCIASSCMAWKFTNPALNIPAVHEDAYVSDDEPLGYCGLTEGGSND